MPTRHALPGSITLLRLLSLLKIPHNRAHDLLADIEMDAEELKKRIASGDCKVVDNTSSKVKSSVWEKFGVI